MVAGRSWADAAGLRGEQAQYTPCERLRKGRGWSQVRTAGLAGVSIDSVRDLEHGFVAKMQAETLMRIAAALDCSVLDLVPGFAVKHGRAGGGAVKHDEERRRVRRQGGEARRERVRTLLVELLRAHGGRMKRVDIERELAPYDLTYDYLKARKVELGIWSQRAPGWGNRVDAWEWVLPQATAEAAASPDR